MQPKPPQAPGDCLLNHFTLLLSSSSASVSQLAVGYPPPRRDPGCSRDDIVFLVVFASCLVTLTRERRFVLDVPAFCH